MSFDTLVLGLAMVGLHRLPSRSSLWNFMFRDGVSFFMVAFICNLIVAIMAILNLDFVLSSIPVVPAATISAAAATRCYIRLSTFTDSASEGRPPANSVVTGTAFGFQAPSVSRSINTGPHHLTRSGGVRFQFDDESVDFPNDGRLRINTGVDSTFPTRTAGHSPSNHIHLNGIHDKETDLESADIAIDEKEGVNPCDETTIQPRAAYPP